MKNNLILKNLTVIFFVSFIFMVPTINIFTEDKKVSETENKILTQLPDLTVDSVLSKRFMTNFDKYTSDQFPMREKFVVGKNKFDYMIGNREFNNIYFSKGRLLEKFTFNKDIFDSNLNEINSLSSILSKYNIDTTLALIPTSIEFYKDYLPSYALSDSQKNSVDYAKNLLEDSFVNKVYSPIDILSNNKDKYIYFNTDHHWTQLGAYLCYLDMFNYEYTDDMLYKDYNLVSDNFLGTYYSKVLLNVDKDSIHSYSNVNDFNISIDFNSNYDTLYSTSKLNGKNKYQYFLHGDPAFAIIDGNSSQSEELIIFKDSFAHCFIPFLCNEYSKIHIVDPRYYNIDLEEYLVDNPNISQALFFNNLQQLNSVNFYKSK